MLMDESYLNYLREQFTFALDINSRDAVYECAKTCSAVVRGARRDSLPLPGLAESDADILLNAMELLMVDNDPMINGPAVHPRFGEIMLDSCSSELRDFLDWLRNHVPGVSGN